MEWIYIIIIPAASFLAGSVGGVLEHLFRRDGMKPVAVFWSLLLMVVLVSGGLVGCGGGPTAATQTPQARTFKDKAGFEDEVLHYLSGAGEDVTSVSCTKTSITSARCTGSNGVTYLVLCESADSAGGHNCSTSQLSP